MGTKVKRFFRRLWIETGYARLGGAFGRFLCVIAVYTIASLLSNSFFNIFLLRVTGSSMAMMRYNLVLACVQPPAMLAAVVLVRRHSTALSLRVGLSMHALAYLILTIDGNPSELVVYALSALFSVGNGFYYTSYTPLLLTYTTDRSRDAAQSSMGLLSTVAQLVLPLLTGMFISSFGNLTGYRILFAISTAILLAGIGFSYRLAPVGPAPRTPHSIRLTARNMIRNPNLVRGLFSTMLLSFMTSGSAYYVSLLVYNILKHESAIGALNTVCGIITMLTALAYGRVVTAKKRGVSMLAGALVAILAIGILCLFPTRWGYTVYALIYSAASLFLNYPDTTAYFSVVQHDPLLRDYTAEVHALRENFVTLGRALALVPAFFLKDTVGTAGIMMLLLALCQIPAALLVCRVVRETPAGDD